MALKHYGGSLPSAGPLEWTCPACGHQNAVPLKAGCQQCGQKDGAGARKVEEPGAVPTSEAEMTPALAAYLKWLSGKPFGMDHAQVAQEAFMAGVAWAQGNREPLPPPLMAGTSPVTAREETPVEPAWGLLDNMDEPTRQTLLAALAFYRDNVLNYGAVPGQLDAQGVTDLVARLSPEEVPHG